MSEWLITKANAAKGHVQCVAVIAWGWVAGPYLALAEPP